MANRLKPYGAGYDEGHRAKKLAKETRTGRYRGDAHEIATVKISSELYHHKMRRAMEEMDVLIMEVLGGEQRKVKIIDWGDLSFLDESENDKAKSGYVDMQGRHVATKDDLFILPGDTVIALQDGKRDPKGLPQEVPLAGHRYVVHSFYAAPYGMGVVLNNVDGTPLDNYPYRGYIFTMLGTRSDPQPRIYFKKDDEDTLP